MAFDFSYADSVSKTTKNNYPIVRLYNMAQTAQSSYIYLNKAAVDALNLGEDRLVRVGIDTDTKKIVVIASNGNKGRKLTKSPSGAGSISIGQLIEENHIPTQECSASFNRNYGGGGIIFTYSL